MFAGQFSRFAHETIFEPKELKDVSRVIWANLVSKGNKKMNDTQRITRVDCL